MILVTSEQVRVIDQATIGRFAVPGVALTETAGAAAASLVLSRWPRSARKGVLVVAGKGNNGGDGWVAARHLFARGIPVEVVLVGATIAELTGDPALTARAWGRDATALAQTAAPEEVISAIEAEASMAGVVLDGLLGTGLSKAPRGPVAAAIECLARLRERKERPRILSLDVPSGLDASTGEVPGACVRADHTITFGFAKTGLMSHPGARFAGGVTVAPIGWPRAALELVTPTDETIEESDVHAWLPPLPEETHKGNRGRVLVIAGRDERPGAAALAAHAAFRAGAGTVTVATTREAGAQVVAAIPEVMLAPLASKGGAVAASAAGEAVDLAEQSDAVIAGPGLGTGGGPAAVIAALAKGGRTPMVLDADGLTVLAQKGRAIVTRPCVLTPHPGEMGRLLGLATAEVQARRVRCARDAAAAFGAVAVLKGSRSLVADPSGRLAVNRSGNPGLATAGAGDVLAGILGAWLAAGLDPWKAARAAVWAHGAAADLARREAGGAGFLARDVADRIPAVARR